MTLEHDITRPPCDSAAECALLHWAMGSPFKIRALQLCDFSKLLHGFWEHRAVWDAIQRALASQEWPYYPGDAFDVAVLAELCRGECTGTHAFLTPDDWPNRCRAPAFLGLIQPYWVDIKGNRHPRLWAADHSEPADLMQRLRDCRDARQLIADAQEQAERAWRLDLAGARRVAARASTTPALMSSRLLSV